MNARTGSCPLQIWGKCFSLVMIFMLLSSSFFLLAPSKSAEAGRESRRCGHIRELFFLQRIFSFIYCPV